MASSSSEPSTSLLDLLIKTEQASEDAEDPLDKIGNIGETVISQLAGDAFSTDIQQSICQNAFKLFDQAMSYTKSPAHQKRKYTRWKTLGQRDGQSPSDTVAAVLQASHAASKAAAERQLHESNIKRFQKADLSIGLHPRAKFDVPVTEFFEQGQKASVQFNVLHESIEQQKTQRLDDQVSKDVDRLLGAASRIYGPKKWSPAEKAEFSKYCRLLRTGALSDEDHAELKKFYARAYGVQGEMGPKPNLEISKELQKVGIQLSVSEETKEESKPVVTSPMKRKTNHKEEEEMFYQKKPMLEAPQETKSEVLEEEEDAIVEDSSLSSLASRIPFPPFHPGMKYEREKEFRTSVIRIFLEANSLISFPKKRGRPKLSSRLAMVPSGYMPKTGEEQSKLQEEVIRRRKNDLAFLMSKMNEKMENVSKVWTAEETTELGRFYDLFKEKMNFTIIQTKELGNFLRKAFGRLEQYEIERENDTALQEKRKFWQEYKRNHEPVARARQNRPNIMRAPSIRPYIKKIMATVGDKEEEGEEKTKKGDYQDQWRAKRGETQSDANNSLIESATSTNGERSTEPDDDQLAYNL